VWILELNEPDLNLKKETLHFYLLLAVSVFFISVAFCVN